MTSLTSARETVQAWFDQVKCASIELPDRSFGGGAGRSLHRLTGVHVLGRKLAIELDGQLLLILTDPGEPLADADVLSFDSYGQLVFDWQEFGNFRTHAEVFDAGGISFIAQTARP